MNYFSITCYIISILIGMVNLAYIISTIVKAILDSNLLTKEKPVVVGLFTFMGILQLVVICHISHLLRHAIS